MIERPDIEIAEEEPAEQTAAAFDADARPELAPAPDSDVVTEPERRVNLFPDLFISGLTAVVLALCVYSLLCIFLPAGLDVRANPLSPPEGLKPAWYFLFLYRLLGPLPPLASALVPVLLLVVLGMWPFLDRNPAREPRRRLLVLGLGALVGTAVLVLTYLGWVA